MFYRHPEKLIMPTAEQALPGRDKALPLHDNHYVLNVPLKPPYPEGCEQLVVGMGCFWGAEKRFWGLSGVVTTAVGYSAGFTPNPTYEEVCSGRTGHNEVVLVVYDTQKISTKEILQAFWESHNPTQGMRQGNDRGTQYRSGVYFFTAEQEKLAQATQAAYQLAITRQTGQALDITTEILPAGEFYFAEDYHQQYLAKNPGGYCGLGGMGVCFEPESKA